MAHVEVVMEGCFLCSPEVDLMYWSDRTSLALCGLGPVVKGYSVVAPRLHIRSAADAAAGEAFEFLAFASDVRARLSKLYGQCLLTEHGRLPVCVDVSGTTDPHCYHAHFLMFPGAPTLEDRACSYFARVKYASSLVEALEIAQVEKEYFLFSPNPQRFVIMTRPGRLIRQFARLLVAEALGRPELANWRRYPLREEVASTAAELRSLFAKER
jgi:hypothetical protein